MSTATANLAHSMLAKLPIECTAHKTRKMMRNHKWAGSLLFIIHFLAMGSEDALQKFEKFYIPIKNYIRTPPPHTHTHTHTQELRNITFRAIHVIMNYWQV